MEKKALKVVIAGRTYPLTINKEEEGTIVNAAEKINHNIKKLQNNYAVKDMQDLLAMTALQLAIQKEDGQTNTNEAHSIDISTLEQEITRIINKINNQI